MNTMRIFRLSLVLVGLILTGWAPVLAADPPASPPLTSISAPGPDLPLELQILNSDLVYVSSATKYLRKLSEVPGSVFVITPQAIREYGAISLSEILDRACGIQILKADSMFSVEVRGLFSPLGSKVMVLENGRILNQAEQGFDPTDFGASLDNIKQIEVIKGPSSALYGRDAYAGVVNIVTKDGRDLNGLHAKTSLGWNHPDPAAKGPSQYYHLAYGRREGNWDYTVTSGYWRQFGLSLRSDPPNNLYDGERCEASLKYKDRLSLRAGYHKSESATFSFISTGDRLYQDHLYGDAAYQVPVNDYSHLTFRAEDTYYPWQGAQRYLPASGPIMAHPIATLGDLPSGILPGQPQIMYDDGRPPSLSENAVGGFYLDSESFLKLLNFSLLEQAVETGSKNEFLCEAKYELSWPEHNYLLAGVDFLSDWSDRNVYYTPIVTDQNLAGYLQDEYHWGGNFIFLGGIRYDFNTAYANAVSPRLSAIYAPVPGLRLKAFYGTAYRAPNDMERNTDVTYGPVSIRGNPDLKPETIQQGEAGVEYECGNWLQAKAAFFYYETQNEITYTRDSDPYYVYLTYPDAPPVLLYSTNLNFMPHVIRWNNDNGSLGRGFELETKYRPSEFFSLTWNYAHWYQSSRRPTYFTFRADGEADLINGSLSFHYTDLVFLNFYAHCQHLPRVGSSYAEVLYEWIPVYDVTLGGAYRGWNLTLACYNLSESPMIMASDLYLKRPRIFRVNLEYAYAF
jgi:outer membrane receptor for ferrienterochelin and colicins